MRTDDVVNEVRRARDTYARQFQYDLDAIHRDLKRQEREGGRKVVSLPPRRPRPMTQALGADRDTGCD
ncbi:hypothetical protein AB1L88_22250 [Tautonia sp. JC769]|uniref:hypothetical protein n=1 Tax=Tautonia sp. JC769 TaxID=3232135 RepID=UPI0034590621